MIIILSFVSHELMVLKLASHVSQETLHKEYKLIKGGDHLKKSLLRYFCNFFANWSGAAGSLRESGRPTLAMIQE